MPDVITVDLIRHGVTVAGTCFLGATDAPLTEQGWLQMQSAIELAVAAPCYQQVVSSPLLRCVDFARRYTKDNNLPLHIESDLREINFGAWEGKTAAEVWETQQQQLSAFWSDPANNSPPSGESYRVFQQRVDSAFKKLLSQAECENMLIIGHGGVIRQIISSILHLSPETSHSLYFDYAGMSRVESYNGNLSLRFINQQIQS
ncbi:Alpha-ribazole-5'-phosphate phosphatase [hydrothermal vent metagenome]|uniref:Alpha-ribazole-5'-phosphate phosphatase n=1 Tax=hydrothermal vent metagenome TaxID=652676 RepID=A0A3B0WWC5_9ZZZZ